MPQYNEMDAGFVSKPNSASSLLKWLNCLYRPALPEEIRGRLVPLSRQLLGRRQVVRQGILIPPCGGSNPPAPARPSQAPEDTAKSAWVGRWFTALRHMTASPERSCPSWPISIAEKPCTTGGGVFRFRSGAGFILSLIHISKPT